VAAGSAAAVWNNTIRLGHGGRNVKVDQNAL
jgi:hypothetical protein